MPQVLPFKGLRPCAGAAAELISPPYDVLDRSEARAFLNSGTRQFLHVSKPEAGLPDSIAPTDEQVYVLGATNLREFMESGKLLQDSTESYYVYRLRDGEHVQTGLVATVLCADYECNRIRRHELTRPEKESDRRNHMLALGAQTGPVLMAHDVSPELQELLATICRNSASYRDLDLDGVKHSLWRVVDGQVMHRFEELLGGLPHLYIADGHHRSAAACSGEAVEPGGRFLAAMFSRDQLRILDYNRVVSDLGGLEQAEFLSRISAIFDVKSVDKPYQPRERGRFGMYLDGKWYALTARPETTMNLDIVNGLDVSLLADLVLEPVLGICDVRRDPRIDFIGGSRGLQALEARVDSGAMTVAFSLFPTAIDDVLAVADRQQHMPPKSTWFHPKLADGLVSFMPE
jgi:uncharacterized protein (DUF1015 family)